MKITSLYVVYPGDLNTPTGGYRYDRRLARELEALGVDVRYIALAPDFPFADAASIGHAERVFRALPDGATVLVDGLALGVLDTLAEAEQKRLNLIALCHHPLALESGLTPDQKQVFFTTEQRALRAVSAVVVTSHHTRDILLNQFSLSKDRITVALPGNDPAPFAPCSGDPIRLLTVASLTRRKAHDVLISALSALSPLAWEARFIGSNTLDPQWAEALHQQVIEHGLQHRITFVGTTDKLDEEYQGADIFVLPSRFEGYGMVFAEAIAAGLPVVGARAGAVPDVVPASAGRLVPPDDPKALADALRELLTHEPLRRALQRGARAAASTLPTWPQAAERVLSVASGITADRTTGNTN